MYAEIDAAAWSNVFRVHMQNNFFSQLNSFQNAVIYAKLPLGEFIIKLLTKQWYVNSHAWEAHKLLCHLTFFHLRTCAITCWFEDFTCYPVISLSCHPGVSLLLYTLSLLLWSHNNKYKQLLNRIVGKEVLFP